MAIACTLHYIRSGHKVKAAMVTHLSCHAFTLTIHLTELAKFLRFCTGSAYLPPPGYRERLITVKFDGQAPGVAISTCLNRGVARILEIGGQSTL